MGVLRAVDDRYQVDTRTLLDEWRHKPPRWEWRTRRTYLGADGTRYAPDQLATWQAPAVRHALSTALAALQGPGHRPPAAFGPGQPVRQALAALPPRDGQPVLGTADALYGDPYRRGT